MKRKMSEAFFGLLHRETDASESKKSSVMEPENTATKFDFGVHKEVYYFLQEQIQSGL